MHPQAKEAVARLTGAGFEREDFSVRTTRYRTKQERATHGDYGDALIIFRRLTSEQILERKGAMQESGLSIICFTRRSRPAFVQVFSDGIGSYRELSLDGADGAGSGEQKGW